MPRFAPTLLLLAGLCTGCSSILPSPVVRGNKVDADALKELVPGTSTRADVQSLLGSPTAKASFDNNTWIYISQMTQQRVGRVPGVNSQRVVELVFDDDGVLRDVHQLSQKDAKDVDVIARATPSPGSEASFMQQLLGNVGKFTAGPAAAGGGGGSGLSVQ